MERSRKPLRAVLLALGTAAVLFFALRRSDEPSGTSTTPQPTTEADGPKECLSRYYDAIDKGDAVQYLSCLAEPLRSEKRKHSPEDRQLRDAMRQEMQGYLNWVMKDGVVQQGDKAIATVEEGRRTMIRERRFELERAGERWLIVAIANVSERPQLIPLGTSVEEEAGEKP